MRPEVIDISNFVGLYEPFNQLDETSLLDLCRTIEISYYRAGAQILAFGDPIDSLYLVRTGSVEVSRRDGQLHDRLEPGGVFGQVGILMNGRVRYPTRAIEDTLTYRIPAEIFLQYCDRVPVFGDYFEVNDQSTLKQAVQTTDLTNDMTRAKIEELILTEPVCVDSRQSVQQCAELMRASQVSALIVTDANTQQAIGLITDVDLRNRVLAQGLSGPETPVTEAMTEEMITITSDAYIYEAMLLMMREQIQHLPVYKSGSVQAIISLSDILHFESQNSLLLTRSILRQDSVEQLALLSEQVPQVFVRLYKERASAHMTGTAMSVIGRTFKQRLLELAEQELGPPPVKYCLLALGSMARDEQLVVTDQDNALILDNDYNEALHGEYFAKLARFLCDGLNRCGYPHCSGGIMASNPEWRLTREQWKARFSAWIDQPDPRALLNASIFFDLDGVAGKTRWADELNQFVAEKSCNNRKFLAALARNALNRTPPLGFFREFVLEQDGDHKDSINLKRRGTAPLSDVIRVHALSQGLSVQNSFDRLEGLRDLNLIPNEKLDEMLDALEFLYKIRIRYQARAVIEGRTPSNNVRPDALNERERRTLREAFRVLEAAQRFLKFRYRARAQ